MTWTRALRTRLRRIARGQADEPLRVLEGPRAVHDALAAGVVREVWVASDLEDVALGTIRAAAGRVGLEVGVAPRRDIEQVAGTVTPQGVLALVSDVARPLAEVVARAGHLVWLDGVQDPGNVGAIVRVAAAFGAEGLVVGGGTADPLGAKALRASAGLALRVPFARAEGADAARAFADAGVPVWVLERGGDDLLRVDRAPARLVVAIGAEGQGLSDAERRAASRRLGIPIAEGVDSLNAAVAAGIALAHLARRRA